MIYNIRKDIIARKSDISQVWQCAPAGSPLQQHTRSTTAPFASDAAPAGRTRRRILLTMLLVGASYYLLCCSYNSFICSNEDLFSTPWVGCSSASRCYVRLAAYTVFFKHPRGLWCPMSTHQILQLITILPLVPKLQPFF